MLRIFIEEPNLFCDPTYTYITESCHTISHRTSLRHGGVTGDTHGKCKNYHDYSNVTNHPYFLQSTDQVLLLISKRYILI